MNGIQVGEVLVLENQKEFFCIRKVNDGGINYVLLVSNYKPLEVKFAREVIEGETLKITVIGDKQEKQRLLALFQRDAKQEINVL